MKLEDMVASGRSARPESVHIGTRESILITLCLHPKKNKLAVSQQSKVCGAPNTYPYNT